MHRILVAVAGDEATGQVVEVSKLLADGRLTPARVDQEVAGHRSIIQVLDAAGRVIGASSGSLRSPFSPMRPAPGERRSQEQDAPASRTPTRWVVVGEGVRPISGPATGQPLVVLVAIPLSADSATVRDAASWLGGGAVLVLLLVVVLVRRSVDAALEPVRRISDEVDSVRAARNPGRVTVPRTDDEIMHLAVVMNRMLERLDRADAATRAFLSNASHELRSPLATVQVLVEGQPHPDGTPGHVRDRIIAGEVARMQRLVDDLLTLAKADDARLDLAVDEVDLDDLVDQEVRRLRSTSPLRVEARIDAARVVGDVGRLQQVLRNLSDNAVRHARTAIRIELSDRDGGDGMAELLVDNDGPTLPPESREVVFDRFVRLPGDRQLYGDPASPGSGLGLAIVKTVVEAHHGTVRAGESPGGWCRFEVRLPLQNARIPHAGGPRR